MSQENKDVNYFDFLGSYKEQINLDIGLSFPGSSTVREFTLMGKSLAITTPQLNDGNSSDQQHQHGLARATPLPPEEEVEINLTPVQWTMLEKRLEERQIKLVEKEEERCRSVSVGEGKGNPGIRLHESMTINIGSSRAMENLKSIGAGENSNAPSANRPTDNEDVLEVEESTYYRAIARSREKNPGKRPVTREVKNPQKKSCHCIETPTPLLELLAQMPGVLVVSPTGQKIEGILAKFGPDQIRMVCICHGDYFDDVDFVKHAGWKEVTNPMRHIKVLPKSI